MSNETPYIYEGIDPAHKSPLDTVVETARDAVSRTSAAFESAKKPGMPLSILANVAREAPLGALFAAFVIGVMVGRRR